MFNPVPPYGTPIVLAFQVPVATVPKAVKDELTTLEAKVVPVRPEAGTELAAVAVAEIPRYLKSAVPVVR